MSTDINTRSDTLSRALSKGDMAKFRELYLQDIDVRSSWPWLYAAARRGNAEAVEFLLQQGRDPNEVSTSSIAQSALSAACGEGSPAIAKMLIDAGASVELTRPMDNPLFAAIPKNSIACVKLLVESGIDIHREYKLEDGRTRNALELAERWGCKDIAEYLRSEGALLPGDKSAHKSSPLTQLVSKLRAWFHADASKSLGSIGLGGNFAEAELRWFDMSTMDHPFLTLFTVGLSGHLLATPAFGTKEARVELMMHLPFTWPMDGEYAQDSQFAWPLDWMRLLPQHILSGSIPLPGTHLIISNDEPPAPLGPGTEQTCLLLLADFYQCFPVELSNGEKVHVFHVVPLYTGERDFEKTHGMQPLLEAMASQGLQSLVVRPDRGRFVP